MNSPVPITAEMRQRWERDALAEHKELERTLRKQSRSGKPFAVLALGFMFGVFCFVIYMIVRQS